MMYDLYRCNVYGEEQILTREEYDALHTEALRRHKGNAVKLGPWCGVRYDDKPDPPPQPKVPKHRKPSAPRAKSESMSSK